MRNHLLRGAHECYLRVWQSRQPQRMLLLHNQPPRLGFSYDTGGNASTLFKTCDRSHQMRWHQHLPCEELNSVLQDDSLSVEIKETKAQAAVSALGKSGERLHSHDVQSPETDAYDAAKSMIQADVDVQRPRLDEVHCHSRLQAMDFEYDPGHAATEEPLGEAL